MGSSEQILTGSLVNGGWLVARCAELRIEHLREWDALCDQLASQTDRLYTDPSDQTLATLGALQTERKLVVAAHFMANDPTQPADDFSATMHALKPWRAANPELPVTEVEWLVRDILQREPLAADDSRLATEGLEVHEYFELLHKDGRISREDLLVAWAEFCKQWFGPLGKATAGSVRQTPADGGETDAV